jgi:hypothetical protein
MLIATTGDVALDAVAAAVGGIVLVPAGGRLPTVVLVTPVGGSVVAPAPANPACEGPVTVDSPDPQPSAAMMATSNVLERTTFIFKPLGQMPRQEHTLHTPEPEDGALDRVVLDRCAQGSLTSRLRTSAIYELQTTSYGVPQEVVRFNKLAAQVRRVVNGCARLACTEKRF